MTGVSQLAETTFLGHSFRLLNRTDKAMLQDNLRRYPRHVSGYTFATQAAYAPIYAIAWSQVAPEYLSRLPLGQPGKRHGRSRLA